MIQSLADLCIRVGTNVASKLEHVFLSAGSIFSIFTLFSAFCIAALFLVVRRRRAGRHVRIRGLLRALFPKALVASGSGRADIALAAMNILIFGALISVAIFSAPAISTFVNHFLVSSLGERRPVPIPQSAAQLLMTVVLFLAYEFGYWSNHYVSHRIPYLWEFHRVHHTAEQLSPLTVYRVHPIDSIVFANFLAVSIGVAAGVTDFALGHHTDPFMIAGTNLLFLSFLYVTVHLQHSHIWIAADGWLGRVFMSPAHHQLHHSDDPAHHDSNYGSCLAVWDWIFGTLVMPQRRRPALTFGAGPHLRGNHTLVGLLAAPFSAALARLPAFSARRFQRSLPPAPLSDSE